MTPSGVPPHFHHELEDQQGAIPTPPPALPAMRVSRPTELGGQSSGHGVTVSLPETNFPPPGSQVIDENADLSLATVVIANTPIWTYNIPDGRRLTISGIGWGADDERCLARINWGIDINRNPSNFFAIPAGIGTLTEPYPVGMTIPGPANVRVVLIATAGVSGNPTNFQVRVLGWISVPVKSRDGG